MYVEERIYTLHPGKLAAFLKVYEEKGSDIQKKILGNRIGWYVTDIGELNLVVHLWAYQSLDDRDRRRAELMKDPVFQEYLAAATPLIAKMENRIMKPASFFADDLERMLAAVRR
jgi:hypothetical protein